MKRYIEQGPERSQVQEFLSHGVWGAPRTLHMGAFTNPEAL